MYVAHADNEVQHSSCMIGERRPSFPRHHVLERLPTSAKQLSCHTYGRSRQHSCYFTPLPHDLHVPDYSFHYCQGNIRPPAKQTPASKAACSGLVRSLLFFSCNQFAHTLVFSCRTLYRDHCGGIACRIR